MLGGVAGLADPVWLPPRIVWAVEGGVRGPCWAAAAG